MGVRDFDYNKTIETKKLVYKGIYKDKMMFLALFFVMFISVLILSYMIFQSFFDNADSRITDYIMAFLIPLILISSTLLWGYYLINRDRLKEIPIKLKTEHAKSLFIEAAETLNWRVDMITKNYILFARNYNKFFNESHSILLIVFPDKKIYFNSINYEYPKPARFSLNYEEFVYEYQKLEKQIS
jgi:hypothetical protein